MDVRSSYCAKLSPVRGFCQGCDKPLTGKQRKWCSDACRMRVKRTAANSGTFSPGSGLVSEVRQSFGNVRISFANGQKNTIQAGIIISFDSQGWEAEWDGFVIKTELKNHLRQFLGQILRELFPKWQFGWIEIEIRRF